MAKKKLHKSKSNFTLRRLHQSGSYGNIYERDYTTIVTNIPRSDGQIPIYNSPSFKLSVRAGINGQKKYNYGNWINNPNTCNGNQGNLWTLGCMPEPNKTDSKIKLKPSKKRLTDFACYGSALELIRTTLTNIVSKFPAELYITNRKVSETKILTNGTIPQDSDLSKMGDGFIVENPLCIDIIQSVVPEDSLFSPLRYFCVSEYDYNVLDNNDNIVLDGESLKKWNEEHPESEPKHLWEVTSVEEIRNNIEIADQERESVKQLLDMWATDGVLNINELTSLNQTFGGVISDYNKVIEYVNNFNLGKTNEYATFVDTYYTTRTVLIYYLQTLADYKNNNGPDSIEITPGIIDTEKGYGWLYKYYDDRQMLLNLLLEIITPKECLSNGDLLAQIKIGNIIIHAYVYEDSILYLSKTNGYKIRPNNTIINNFFDNLDDFENLLLNQYTDYTAKFDTYIEDEENGWYVVEKEYKWPLADGNWNIAIKGIDYSTYVDDLYNLATGYDELFTNAIWRSMTHEAIANMDLTTSDSNEDITSDSSKIKQVLNVIGRQFDDIKKYADNIKYTNIITYDQEQNTPDYFLSDNLDLSGWEVKEILNEIDDSEITDPIYGARTIGFNAGDANNEFMRRLQLNSKRIFAEKGTKRAIEDLMAVFGFHSMDWFKNYYGKNLKENQLKNAFAVIEYVYVANGYANSDKVTPEKMVDRVKSINQLKDNFNYEEINNPEAFIDDYQGLPVTEVTIGDKTRIVPWFNRNHEYDSDLYFQMKGGWARNDGNSKDEQNIYGYSVSKINYVNTFDELYEIPYSIIDENGVYYIKGEDKYFKVNDIEQHQTLDGWVELNEKEKLQVLNIIDTNKGNNPHIGEYDSGISYLESYGQLFKDSEFKNTRGDEVSDRLDYGFNIIRQADSTKCLFFGDLALYGTAGTLRGDNRIAPYNFFDGDSFDEAASLSVINSKELHIIFDDTYRSFLEKDVLPYIKQIIPSTTIFSYSFEHLTIDINKAFEARTHNVICNAEICPIYGITE